MATGAIDPYKYLKIRFNPDGSLVRYGEAPLLPASPAGEPVTVATNAEEEGAAQDNKPAARRIVTVHSNDVPLNAATGTSLRLYIPSVLTRRRHHHHLPLIIYFHGGGYVLFRAASAPFHTTCTSLAAAVPASVASVDYRLAPEHRLPAAFHDAADAVRWAADAARRNQPVFVMGSHNGASIAFRAALAAVDQDVPLRGVVLNQPHAGGMTRTPAEAESVDDRVLPLAANDLLWNLSLPVGADRDHPFCNEEAMLAAVGEARLRRLPPCLVLGRRRDPPRDRTRRLVDALRKAGVDVEARLDGAGYHAMELFKDNCAAEFIAQVSDFVRRRSSAAGDNDSAAGDVVGVSKL